MKSPRERAAEGLQVGDCFTVSRCFSEDEIPFREHKAGLGKATRAGLKS